VRYRSSLNNWHPKVKSSAEIAGGEFTQPVMGEVMRSEQQTKGISVPVTQTRDSHDNNDSSSSSDAHTSSSS